MDIFLTRLWKAFNGYWTNTQISDWQFWAYIIGAILITWVISILLNKFLIKPGLKDEIKKLFYIHRSWILGSFLTACFLIAMICFWWSKNIYNSHHLEFAHLVALILVLIIPIISAIKLRAYYTSSNLNELTHQPVSKIEENRLTQIARKAFFKNRLFIGIGAAGFLFLLTLLYRSAVLISIVIDDSGSMGESLKIGSNALNETFSRFDPKYTHVVITSFGKSSPLSTSPYPNFTSLSKVNDISKLDANTLVCSNLQDATNYVSGLQADKGLGLNQAIWQNFIQSKIKYNEDSTNYGGKVLLIISDGLEYDRNWYSKTFCDQSVGLNTFYEDNINWIDLQDKSSNIDPLYDGFGNMMKECYPSNIYPGLGMENYSEALSSVLNDFELDWRLIIWTAIIFVLLTLVFFFIEPKKIV